MDSIRSLTSSCGGVGSSVGGATDVIRKPCDITISLIKSAIDCVEPLLDLARPTCGPLIDLIKNIVTIFDTL